MDVPVEHESSVISHHDLNKITSMHEIHAHAEMRKSFKPQYANPLLHFREVSMAL